MRPRYMKQRDRFRCGPVAILNALKWAGVRATAESDLPRLCRMSKCDDERGATHQNMDSALRLAGLGHFKVRLVRRPKLYEIESHLRGGGAIIVNYGWERITKDYIETARHYALMSDMSLFGVYFGMANYHSTRPAYQRVHRDTIKNHVLRYQRVDRTFKAWFLTKDD